MVRNGFLKWCVQCTFGLTCESIVSPKSRSTPLVDGLREISGWWFQIFFIFIPIWGRFPFWLIFFRGVGTTNQDLCWSQSNSEFFKYHCLYAYLIRSCLCQSNDSSPFIHSVLGNFTIWHFGKIAVPVLAAVQGSFSPPGRLQSLVTDIFSKQKKKPCIIMSDL